MSGESKLPLSNAVVLYGGMGVVAWLGAWWLLDGPYPAPLVLSSAPEAAPPFHYDWTIVLGSRHSWEKRRRS